MDVYDILNNAKLGRFHYTILVLTSLIYMLTALNVMLIGAVIRPISLEWGLDIIVAGYIISIGFLGMFFGAIIFGRLSDIIGRRKTIIFVLVIEAVFTALHGLAYDTYSLAILRFLAGIGLGAALPQPGIYISEYVPVEYRGRFLGIVETSWVYGALLSLLFPYVIIPNYGWRMAFIVGLLPIILIPFVLTYLPESIRYMLKRGLINRIKEVLVTNGLADRDTPIEYKDEEIKVRYGIKDIFSRKYISRTVLLALLWVVLVYTYYAVFIWLPTLYAKEFGLTIVKSLFWTIVITLFQIPGYYSATFLLDKIGRKRVLGIYLIIAGVASMLLGLIIDQTWVFIWSAAISFFNLGAWAGLYTYTPELYPTEVRGAGSGFAASMGRIAGIIAPTVTAYLYAISGLFGPYVIIALVHVIGGIAVILIGIETMGRTLEELEV
jgi:putative MFS transporter